MNRALRGVALGVAALAMACAGPPGPADMDASVEAGQGYVALSRDFADYQSWQRYDLGYSEAKGHPAGNRVVYLSVPGPLVNGRFPIGTRMVKAITLNGTPTTVEYVGAVKRGGGFNGQGAVDWEFFLLRATDAGLGVLARGVNPSFGPGDNYGGGANCNDCHAAPGTELNDYVLAPPVQPAAWADGGH